MGIFFDIFYVVIILCYLPFVMFRRKWYQGLAQRLGFYPKDIFERAQQRPVIWIHAVSVGEVLAIVDLVKQLAHEYANCQIICSTVTLTGYELARESFAGNIDVILAPADFSPIVRRIVKRFRPRIYIAAETELWPNLYHTLKVNDVPVVLVNGRISDRSLGNYLRARFFFRRAMEAVRIFAMQTIEDERRIIALGAEPSRVRVVGNLKFQSLENYTQTIPFTQLSTYQILLGGSTHPGEDELLLECLAQVRTQFPEMRLVIAPRHVERSDDVIRTILAKGMKAQRIGELEGEWPANVVLVVDRMGLLRSLYNVASIVFIGKSFVVGGGQNMIEPIAFGKPTFVGPLTQNFKDVVAIFLREKVLFQVDRPENLASEMLRVLKDPHVQQELIKHAPEVIRGNYGTRDKIVKIIKDILPPAAVS